MCGSKKVENIFERGFGVDFFLNRGLHFEPTSRGRRPRLRFMPPERGPLAAGHFDGVRAVAAGIQ